jgi:GDPmannose 4,6-dehydratase
MPIHLILGVGGQDGSYLAELLTGCCANRVVGLYRKSSMDNLARLKGLEGRSNLKLIEGDILDPVSLWTIIGTVEPDYIYNVADQDRIPTSYSVPAYTQDISIKAVGYLLEAALGLPGVKVFQPVSATMLDAGKGPVSSASPLLPESPYACAKAAVYHLCNYYRSRRGLLIYTGIMCNHDSPLRKEGYLLDTIINQLQEEADPLELWYPELSVDIGYARDFMRLVIRWMREHPPRNLVIGTGRAYPLQNLVNYASAVLKRPVPRIERTKQGPAPASLIADTTELEQEGLEPPTRDALATLRLKIERGQL